MEEAHLALVAQRARHVVLHTETRQRLHRSIRPGEQTRASVSVNAAMCFTLQLQGLLLELTTPLLSHVEPSVGGKTNKTLAQLARPEVQPDRVARGQDIENIFN